MPCSVVHDLRRHPIFAVHPLGVFAVTNLSRRGFLLAAGTAAAGVTAGVAGNSPAVADALRVTERRAIGTAGTTLDAVATPTGASGFRRLAAGPGWPLVVRNDLADDSSTRDDRRAALASFVQLTDLHIVDTQSPMRFEYLHTITGSAHRPHETLSPLGAASLVDRVNQVRRGPFTGRQFDMVINTGDNTDNHESIELDWYLGVLNGGVLTPNTGDPSRYEGVQNSGSTLFWNPETALADMYKSKGFPEIPGLLDAAIRQFRSNGLDMPWYATFGNHDDSIEGTLPSDNLVLEAIYTGSVKIEGVSSATAQRMAAGMRRDVRPVQSVLQHNAGAIRTVTPDARRKPFTPHDYLAAHLNASNVGPGPVGHGYDHNNLDATTAYYTLPIAPGVLGISLDSTNRAGWTNGSLGGAQFRWLEKVLTDHSSHYYDSDGHLVRHPASDQLFLLFSHHTSRTMTNLLPDPHNLFDGRHSGDEVVDLLQRFPNVLAWVNGHTHQNEIIAHGSAVPERAFWEINTASHVDYPQHARVIEVADNADGTLSLFTTLIESAARYETNFDDLSQPGLGSLYRELAFNDIHASTARLGQPQDHNTELLLPNPLPRGAIGR